MITEKIINSVIAEEIKLLKESTLYFYKKGDYLYPMGNGAEIIGKNKITWDEFEFGLSQRLVKNGYRIAINGDI